MAPLYFGVTKVNNFSKSQRNFAGLSKKIQPQKRYLSYAFLFLLLHAYLNINDRN